MCIIQGFHGIPRHFWTALGHVHIYNSNYFFNNYTQIAGRRLGKVLKEKTQKCN